MVKDCSPALHEGLKISELKVNQVPKTKLMVSDG